jgi:hypothetical protein
LWLVRRWSGSLLKANPKPLDTMFPWKTMRKIAFILMLWPLIFIGQNKLFLQNQSSGKTIKIKKHHYVVCRTHADKRFSGDVKNHTSTSMTLKIIRPVDNNKNGYMDTVISFSDIAKLTYARHEESSLMGDLIWYGGMLSALSLLGGTGIAVGKEGRSTGFIFIGAGLLLAVGTIYCAIITGATEYDLISDWKIKTK